MVTLISELREKCSHFIKITPNLGSLDFHSEGILQLCPSWNLIIIMEERMTLSTISPCDEALIFWCCFLLPVNPVERPLQRKQQPDETHSNSYNSAPKVVTGGRQLYPSINLLSLKETTNIVGLKQIRHEQMFHIKRVKGPCWNYKGCMGKQWTLLGK